MFAIVYQKFLISTIITENISPAIDKGILLCIDNKRKKYYNKHIYIALRKDFWVRAKSVV